MVMPLGLTPKGHADVDTVFRAGRKNFTKLCLIQGANNCVRPNMVHTCTSLPTHVICGMSTCMCGKVMFHMYRTDNISYGSTKDEKPNYVNGGVVSKHHVVYRMSTPRGP